MRRFALAVAAIACLLASCTAPFLGGGERGWPDAQVAELLRQLPPEDKYPDAPALIILDQDIIEVFPDGSYKERVRRVVKILVEGVKDYGDVSLGFNSRLQRVRILHARTITPDGRVIPLRKNAIKVITPYSDYPEYSDYKELVFSLPGVEVGSVIDYEILLEGRPEIKGHFSDRLYLQTYGPVLLSRHKIILPKDRELKYLVLNPPKGVDPSPSVSYQGEKKVYLWEFRDIPQILREGWSMPPEGEFTFNIIVTTNDHWGVFFSWWRNLIKGKTEPDEAIKRKVEELTAGLASRRAKIEALFDFVKLKIRYVSVNLGESGYEPTPAREVFENKYGDCKDKSTLLISMLAAAGIAAHYALIPTHRIENLIKDIPYPFQFNHCIVAVEEEGGDGYLFLDPTDGECRFSHLPTVDQGRDVLIFKDDEVLFARTPVEDPRASGRVSRWAVKIRPDGSIEVSAKEIYLGDSDSLMRWVYLRKSPTQIREDLEDKVNSLSPGAELTEYSHSDPLDFKQWFYERFKYYAPDYCQKVRDLLIFRMPGIWTQCPESGKKERRYPLNIWRRKFQRHEVEITLPQGYEVYYLPDPVGIVCPYFEFSSHYTKRGGKVIYTQEFVQKAIWISPKEYPAYRTFCQRMESTNEKQFIFFMKRHASLFQKVE